jgi:hypothetical protein
MRTNGDENRGGSIRERAYHQLMARVDQFLNNG